MKTVGLIVAAGRGLRMGARQPKQYLDLEGKTVLRRSIDALLASSAIDSVQVVIGAEDAELYDEAVAGISEGRLQKPCVGGATRRQSVLRGLEALSPLGISRVLIHDGARPFVSVQIIEALVSALETCAGAFPALPVVDALWAEDADGALRSQPRDNLWRAQTPQAFRFDAILAAHRENSKEINDDVAAAVAAGMSVKVIPGEEDNFKITTPDDIAKAKRLIGDRMDVRVGNGFDVHAFEAGDSVTLCGVEIPFDRSLKGHSDADVAMHAITDAIFGALADGDIGRWFPPSDPTWRGASSHVFLEKAVSLCAAAGLALRNIDCTIICEAPKIGPHAEAMRDRLAGITGLERSRISVKATTSERLGFTGREEGIAAMATATLTSA